MKYYVRPCVPRDMLMCFSADGTPDLCTTCASPSTCLCSHALGEAPVRFAQPAEEPAAVPDYSHEFPPLERPNPKEAPASAKAPLDYLEPLVNAPVARVMKHGGDKYGYRNYTTTPCKIRTYIGAVQRHLDAIAMGEDIDPDSGESHWAHIIAGSSCYLANELSGLAIDNRAATTTPRSDAVHIDGNQDAKAAEPKLPKLDPGYGGF